MTAIYLALCAKVLVICLALGISALTVYVGLAWASKSLDKFYERVFR